MSAVLGRCDEWTKAAFGKGGFGLRVRGSAPVVRAGLLLPDAKRPVSQYALSRKLG